MTVYQWKRAARLHGDPQMVGECLERIREDAGELTASLVVGAAAPEASPLHPYFEWDDAIAAERHREMQAYYLLRSITVTVEKPNEESRQVRAFVVVRTSEDNKDQSYESLERVMGDADLRRQVLQRAWKELEQWRERYHDYEELAGVFAAMEREPVLAQAG